MGSLRVALYGRFHSRAARTRAKRAFLASFNKFLLPITDGAIAHGEISVRTDVNQPGAPSLTALKCQDVSDPADSSISIQVLLPTKAISPLLIYFYQYRYSLPFQWTKPSDFYHSVDSYKIFWRRTDTGGTFKNITVRANRNRWGSLVRRKYIKGNRVFETLANGPIQ